MNKKTIDLLSNAMSVCAWFMGRASYVHVISKKAPVVCEMCSCGR